MTYIIRQNPADPANYTQGRDGNDIELFIIHHAATTYFDGIGRTFQDPNRQTSAHYGVGQNNNVDQYVQDGDTAYHAANWPVNLKSLGFENVNLTAAPDWQVAQSTFNTLVELLRDKAKQYGLLPLVPGVNLKGHKDVSQLGTSCPMTLEPRLQELADAVNNGVASPAPAPAVENVPDQVLHIGEHFVFPKPYRVDGLAFVGGIWQIQCNELCPNGFTWADNGIPAGPVTEVAGGVGAVDQVLEVGSDFEIPGTFEVLNLGYNDGMWLAEVSDGGYKFWVDIASVTEV